MKNSKTKINILDIIVILFVLATVIGIFAKIQLSSAKYSGKKTAVTIELNINDESKTLSKSIYSGDKITVKGSDTVLGTVRTAVNRNNITYINDNGSYVKKFKNDLYRVLVLVDTQAVINDSGIFVDGKFYVAPGLILELETENAVFEGEIVDITVN